MKIYVKDSKDQVCTIENINSSTLVKDLKKIIIEKNNITTGNINLIYNGFNFEDEDVTLQEYDVEEGCCIIYLGEFHAGLKRKIEK